MLQVDTIYLILNTNSLGPTVGANCSRTGLGPKKLLRLLLSFLDWSVCIPISLPASSFRLSTHFPPLGNTDLDGTYNAQVSFSIRRSVARALYDDVPVSWNLCYLYYFSGPILLGQIRELDHV